MTLEEIIAALTGAYKDTYSAQAINATAETLAATGMVTEDNLQAIVTGAGNSLKTFQQEMDRRVNSLQTENAQLKQAAEKTKTNDPIPPQQPNGAATKTTTTEPALEVVPAWAKPLVGFVEKVQATELKQSLSTSLSAKLKAEKLDESVYASIIASTDFKDEAGVDAFVNNLKAVEQARVNAGLSGMSGTPSNGASGKTTELSAEEKAFLDSQKPKT